MLGIFWTFTVLSLIVYYGWIPYNLSREDNLKLFPRGTGHFAIFIFQSTDLGEGKEERTRISTGTGIKILSD